MATCGPIEQFMPSGKFAAPIEMEFGPNGDLYVLEYGTLWFQGTRRRQSGAHRIQWRPNRKPIAVAAVDHPKGALPLRVTLSSAGTVDLGRGLAPLRVDNYAAA